MNTISRDLLKELECPVCLNYMAPPISLCHNGHSVCQPCRQKVEQCPICRNTFINNRSVVLENIARGLQYPCTHQSEGCKQVLPLDLINEHEAVCILGNHICPLNKFPAIECEWEGNWEDFRTHLTLEHPYHAIIQETPFLSFGNGTTMPIIFVMEETFLYYKLRDNDKWYFAIMMIGTRAQAAKYKCVFTLRTEDDVDIILKSLMVRSYTEDFDDILKSYNCLRLDDEEVKKYIYNNELNLTVEINLTGK